MSQQHIQLERVLRAVSLEKDMDGLHPINLEVLRRSRVQIENKLAVVIGCSNVVDLPTALLLQRHNATVPIVHERTPNRAESTRKADIVVSISYRCRISCARTSYQGQHLLSVSMLAQQVELSPTKSSFVLVYGPEFFFFQALWRSQVSKLAI